MQVGETKGGKELGIPGRFCLFVFSNSLYILKALPSNIWQLTAPFLKSYLFHH